MLFFWKTEVGNSQDLVNALEIFPLKFHFILNNANMIIIFHHIPRYKKFGGRSLALTKMPMFKSFHQEVWNIGSNSVSLGQCEHLPASLNTIYSIIMLQDILSGQLSTFVNIDLSLEYHDIPKWKTWNPGGNFWRRGALSSRIFFFFCHFIEIYLNSQSSNVFVNELARYQFWKSLIKCDANHELVNESRVKQGGTSLDKPTDTR